MTPETYAGTAKARKRCPHCNKMVEIGMPAVFRTFVHTRWGFQRGGYIGESGERRTHAYHVECAAESPELRAVAT